MTDRKIFETRDIVVFENGAYRGVSMPSQQQISAIMGNLTREEGCEFQNYLDQTFPGGAAS